ncbi:aspartokinase [Lactococcus hodotermopsidis]|uniref:Aspartokinase n=1 Tax=Pseudolactococcus hodotermopsidis TaxID=2709157 RepID=A0A6A0BDT3_9LACT|nr:aspartate kinase [Lactococcus hodotermopsidis]GFH42966.1 aspartokinase [Lactococcus hodotermopsidis]
MKVIKFGGSSLASAEQLTKVRNIVKSDATRKFVVVSAPGKREANDTKVTDALIAYYKAYKKGEDVTTTQKWIISRYQNMCDELGISGAVIVNIADEINSLAKLPIKDNKFLYDTFLAAGENNNAKLIAEYFSENGINARYIHPQDAGIIVSAEPGNARLLPSSYEKINYLNDLDETLIIPGFFGVTENGEICTFSRGGSDITGSIIAAGVRAELYENFTDVDGIFAAHPGIIKSPASITELTYREMRELAYSGFSVLHDEALLPAYRANVPLVIKNTNNPEHPGTKIVAKRTVTGSPVVGIAADGGFTALNISKYLMNREIGFGRKVLQILENLGIRFEHMPTGIDDMSIIMRDRFLNRQLEKSILDNMTESLQPDELYFEKNLSIMMIVGEDMKEHIGVTARAAHALAQAGVNIEMLSQGSSEVSIMFIVKSDQESAAITALYEEFFAK